MPNCIHKEQLAKSYQSGKCGNKNLLVEYGLQTLGVRLFSYMLGWRGLSTFLPWLCIDKENCAPSIAMSVVMWRESWFSYIISSVLSINNTCTFLFPAHYFPME